MQLKKAIIEQFGRPAGNIGRFIGWLMSIKNNDRSEWTFEKLKVRPTDILLEIGFGPGVTLNKVAGSLTTGVIVGIDHSEIMFDQATKRNKKFIESKHARLYCGTIWELEYPEYYFDIIFGSNVHFFWKNPMNEFSKLITLLKSGGRLVLVFQPRWAKTENEVKKIALNTKNQFQTLGLIEIEVEFRKMSPVTCIYISGLKR